MDYALFRAINNLAGGHPWLQAVGLFFAVMGIFVLPLIILLAHSKHMHRVRMWIEAAVAAILAILANKLIGLVAFRYRPFVAHENVHLLIEKSGLDKSFPSDHTAVAFALATILYLHNKKWGIVGYVLALLIGISRIYVGVHYPTDVLGGIVVGTVAGLLVYFIGRRLIAHKK